MSTDKRGYANSYPLGRRDNGTPELDNGRNTARIMCTSSPIPPSRPANRHTSPSWSGALVQLGVAQKAEVLGVAAAYRSSIRPVATERNEIG